MSKKRMLVILTIVLIFITIIICSFFYYQGKYSIYFETGTNDAFLTKYVSKNSKVDEPPTPIKDGYIFIEWQLDGKKYDFDSKVNKNIILTAKWTKEEYINITYKDEDGTIIDTDKIVKGSTLSELPKLEKENCKFIGWYINDKVYNKEELNDNVILQAKYEQNKIDFKIGDKVLITGKYFDSAFSIDEYYEIAIGWDRVIIDIIDDSNHPYMVGNESGITGFFDSESLELLK